MKFLIAPNAFKGTMTGRQSAEIISKAILDFLPNSEVMIQPVADGGDGTCELLIDSLGLEKISIWSLNSVGQPVFGFLGWDGQSKTAYLDVSTFSGLGILKDYQRDPNLASTYGTGLAINEALKMGTKELVLGLGGSATVDLGSGILGAMGFLFLDSNGREIPMFSPDLMKNTRFVQLPIKLPSLKFTCLCDVKNYFFGENGAVRVFGPQKGLKVNQLVEFEESIGSFFQLLHKRSKKKGEDQSGFGAAGGIAMGLDLFFPTELNYGSSYFFDRVKLEEKLESVDWIITGEGKYDSQSEEGKACYELLQLAKSKGKKIAIITSGTEAYSAGFDVVMELPKLDFSEPGFQNKACTNLYNLVVSGISEGILSS